MHGGRTNTWPAGRWAARWIWAADAPTNGRHVVALRRELDLADVPARVAAISRYMLSVNGVELARGPLRSSPHRQRADEVDLAPALRPGVNVVHVLAVSYGDPTPWFAPPPALGTDLVHGAFVLEAEVGAAPLVTDGTWTGTVLDGWGSTPVAGVSARGVELLDARSLPVDWSSAGGAAGWPAAQERRALAVGEHDRHQPPSFPGGPLGTRPIGWPHPVDIELSVDTSAAAVHDRVVAGTLQLDVEGPRGATITVQSAEFVDADERPAPSEHDAAARLVCDGTRRTLETVDVYGLRGITVAADDGVTVHGITLRERLYPVTEGAAFRCSDPRLETIWDVGRRTVSLCSFDAYLDCPTREQRAWTGDSVVHQMVDLTTNGDWRLARWNPVLAASPRPDGLLPMAVAGDVEHYDFTVIPDWSLHWVHSVWNLHRYVGDGDEIAGLLPIVEGVVRWFERFCGPDGMPADVTGWVIVDWASVFTDGVSSALCGLWGRALGEFAEMSEWVGDRGRVEWARRTHERLAAGFEKLWDAERGRYADSLLGAELRPMASQHGQAAAIVGHLAPPGRWPRLVEVLTDETALVHATFSVPDGPALPNSDAPVGGAYLRRGRPLPWWDTERQIVRAQPFFRYVVHDALAEAGCADRIAGLLLDWETALHRCATSWTETWFGGTVSHGWSSTPTRDLMTRVLGVTPAEPGFAVAAVDPQLGGLHWASGRVPCGEGRFIDVRVTADEVDVDSPVPIEVDGERLPSGHHRIARAVRTRTIEQMRSGARRT